MAIPRLLMARWLTSSLIHELFYYDDRHDDSPSSNNRPTDPVFIWNRTAYNQDTLQNAPIFRTKLNIEPVPEYDYRSWTRKPTSKGILSYYPFDSYQSIISAFAEEEFTNMFVILGLDSISRFLVDLKITIDNNYTVEERWFTSREDIIFVRIMPQRSTLVIGYCLVITVTFWMVTLMICLIMITTVVFGYRQRNEIVVVPIGTMFAFTQLWSTMPGAPDGFGDVLDFAGLLPCLVLLSICAMTMVGIYLFADPNDPSRKAFTWDELGALL
ncbi:hypothetical protein EDD18DRAFT_1357697 [Armillaria luteobubalina]|uniref:Uncharacterized protein n=1 Tax=Armillaria luteobubalina TaxID=153913 RepID=A0AA39Q0C4_9AGAR|nr:hypothetical protein EDD18DRAFT_1357697 [Armillaria luteobubalina]